MTDHGVESLVLEASDGVGGRIRTDRSEGFLFDRGFQILQSAYPEAQRMLNMSALDLRPFYPGAMVRYGGRFHKVADPWRQPGDALAGLLSPIGTFRDKVRIGRLRSRLIWIHAGGNLSSTEYLNARSFACGGIFALDHGAFFAGVFLERRLDNKSANQLGQPVLVVLD